MKIDILDDYIRTPEWFWGLSDKFRSNGGYRTPPPPRKLLGLMGLVVEERRKAKRWHVPHLAQTELD